MAYVIAASPNEVGGLGFVEQYGSDLYVEDVFILDQQVTPHSTTTDPLVLASFMENLAQNGTRSPATLCFQWHSHGTGGAYCSQTDLQNINDWLGDWLISLVLNRYGEHYMRLDNFNGPRLAVRLSPTILSSVPPELLASAQAEVDLKVRRAPNILNGVGGAMNWTENPDPRFSMPAAQYGLPPQSEEQP